ncbi:MAG: RNA-binding domain-containing protein [Candidatus Bathyarchaeia archaeon]
MSFQERNEISPSLIEVSVIAHATENLKKVKKAVLNILPQEDQASASFSIQALKGHHGNPIFMIKTNLKNLSRNFLDFLFKALSTEDKNKLFNEINNHIDKECNLYVRLDKQAAFIGEARIKQEDPIRIRMKFKNWKRSKLLKTLQELLKNEEILRSSFKA